MLPLLPALLLLLADASVSMSVLIFKGMTMPCSLLLNLMVVAELFKPVLSLAAPLMAKEARRAAVPVLVARAEARADLVALVPMGMYLLLVLTTECCWPWSMLIYDTYYFDLSCRQSYVSLLCLVWQECMIQITTKSCLGISRANS